jgi:hypothetical protein
LISVKVFLNPCKELFAGVFLIGYNRFSTFILFISIQGKIKSGAKKRAEIKIPARFNPISYEKPHIRLQIR